jgi:hypothetical protein
LTVDELVLHGFPVATRHRIRDAFERELIDLVAGQGIPPSLALGRQVDSLAAGPIAVASDSSPESVGSAIARAVYDALAGPPVDATPGEPR